MKKSEKLIKESLIAQLDEKSMKFASYCDLIDDYMEFHSIKTQLIADIKKRGLTYQEKSSRGELITKENPSVKNLVNINKQMLQILEKLELDPKKAIPSRDGEDEDI